MPPVIADNPGQMASQLGRLWTTTHTAHRPWMNKLERQVRKDKKDLLDHYEKLAVLGEAGVELPPAAEWILDNYFVIEETLNDLRRSLSSRHIRALPQIMTSNGVWPRIYALADSFLQNNDYAFAIERLTTFIDSFQTSAPLLLAELWALPDMIRAILAHRVAAHAAEILEDRSQRVNADLDADILLQSGRNAALSPPRPVKDISSLPYLAQLLQRLRDKGVDHDEVLKLLRVYDPFVTAPDDVIHRELVRQSAQSHETRNAITGLRNIGANDWVAFCESINAVDHILRAGSDFSALDLPTRNTYRARIEKVAARSGRSEAVVAAEAAVLAQQAETEKSNERKRHIGYYLIAEGYPKLRQRLGLQATVKDRFDEVGIKLRFTLYAMANIGLITLLISSVLRTAFTNGLYELTPFVCSLLLFLPAWEATTALLHNISARLFPVAPLPAIALRDGVPDDLRTAVVIPVIIGSAAEVRDLTQQLEVHYLSNKDDNLSFFLLIDLKDAAAAEMPGDKIILKASCDAIESLNARHPRAQGAARFYLLHRKRQWNAGEQRWMGWERKRGKLHEFNQLLLGNQATSYLAPFPDTSWPQPIRYVVTLDADTRLPHHAVKRLIGKMAHPLNRAVFDPVSHLVVEGYGILQPRIASALPSGDSETLLQRIFYRASGIDPYAIANADLYQDLFAEGSFTGKGIYEVSVFEAALSGRLPDNAILSHDLIEGVFARAGLASDIEVVEEYPRRYDVVCQRQHRWVRGDWQLLPWIIEKRSREVTSVGYWKMVDNLRRSLTPILTFCALVVIWLAMPAPAVALTIIIILLISTPLLIPFLFGVLPKRGMSLRAYTHQLLDDIVLLAKQMTFQMAFLPHQVWLMTDAIVRTLWRLLVTHKHLLEWVTASETMRRAQGGLRAFYQMMGYSVLLAFAAFLMVALVNPHALAFAAPFVFLWLAAPWFAYTASQPVPIVDQAHLDLQQQQALCDVARETWRYFETWVGDEDNSLPPDNFQEDPMPMVAHRTSPTNIGLYLLSAAAALDFGWITVETFLSRVEKTFSALDKLERYRGHFLNWYDTITLRTLEPRYVSTVDSGNLAGYLLTLESVLREIDEEHAQLLATKARRYFEEMDFSFLLNRPRRLMSIGWRVNAECLDESCYDMLASEARLGILLAIAKGDILAQSWFRLSRSVTAIGIAPALVSWAGSMFEYLMPSLLLREPAGSLLGQSLRLIVARQKDYALSHVKAWGVSESAYNARDWEMNYQYSAFGVPGLGIKRGLSENMVLAPYATGLASMVDPVAALENYQALAALGGKGSYGWYEAIDFTPERLPAGAAHVPVRTYMAHHQGMTIVAIHNVLKNGLMRDRFHRQPLVQAVELLLQEVPPRHVSVATPRYDEVQRVRNRRAVEPVKPHIITQTSRFIPAVQILGNSSYNCLITSSGSGYSLAGKTNVSRMALENRAPDLGYYIYVRDMRDGAFWSAAYLPTMIDPDDYAVTFHEHSVDFHRCDGTLDTDMRVVALSTDRGEARAVTLVNSGRRPRQLQLISYMELVLGEGAADAAHPAFSKMFVITRYDAALGSLIATRRPRHSHEPSLWAAHFITGDTDNIIPDGFETDRARFIGRGQNLRMPAALQGEPTANNQGVVLDPIFSLRTTVDVRPGGSVQIVFWTLVADSEDALINLVQKYRQNEAVRQAEDAAWLYSRLYMQHFHITGAEARLFHGLAARLVFNDPAARSPANIIAQNARPQRDLWSAGISGDRPILLLRVNGGIDRKAPELMVKAHTYLAMKGLVFDLVIMHEGKSSYLDPVYQEIEIMVRSRTSPQATQLSGPTGGIYLLRRDQTELAVYELLLAVARLVLTTHGESIGQQISLFEKISKSHATLRQEAVSAAGDPAPTDTATPEFANGYGGFVEDGRVYRIIQSPGVKTPAPWINILTNMQFGCMVAENGTGTSWSGNSRDNKLSPWSNDPVSNPSGEAFYLRDEETGALWSPTSSPIRVPSATYVTHHGMGYSVFETSVEGISSSLTMFVPMHSKHKIMLVNLHNQTTRARRLSLTSYCDLLLGINPWLKSTIITTSEASDQGMLFAENKWPDRAKPEIVYCHIGAPVSGFSGDRTAFLGALGDMAAPQALCGLNKLSDTVGAGTEACFAEQTKLRLDAGQSHTIVILFGVADSQEEALAISASVTVASATEALQATRDFWHEQTSRVSLSTPDRSMDIMLNGWLMYQTMACRLWARSAFYQSSGAYGYRDQLQDVMAALYADPAYTREHILRASSRQFAEGDVQHWWLPSATGPGPGIRTLFSDDPIWLAFVISHYVAITGDTAILDIEVPFLEGPALKPEETEAFFTPTVSTRSVSLAEHCRLAIERGLRIGKHGLCLMGGGDWNDGMNRIGVKGEGESVWLTWFVIRTIEDYLAIATDKVTANVASDWRRRAVDLVKAAEESAWDGQWYRRAFDDDGDAVGASTAQECRIDSIAQSWAVIAGMADQGRMDMAMRSADTLLNDYENRVARLFTPPFQDSVKDPGYIKAYPAGLRENGGQYTHAALWMVMAMARMGWHDKAHELFAMLNPISHSYSLREADRYKTEPYVVVADVYDNSQHRGRGGWSWYTGSSSWMYRVGIEEILGLRVRADKLTLSPHIPDNWPGFDMVYRYGKTNYHLSLRRSVEDSSQAIISVKCGEYIPMTDDGAEHAVTFILDTSDKSSRGNYPEP